MFTPETTDIYDRKNMPRVVFCIHALSLFLYKLGVAPEMDDLTGRATFTDEEISNMRTALEHYGLPMPQFRKIGGIMANEMPVDEAALHAAVIAVNEALDHGSEEATGRAMMNPAACLADVNQALAKKYHIVLSNAKYNKVCAARSRSVSDSYLPDAYDELLTREEIQSHVDKVNLLVALEAVEDAVVADDGGRLLRALGSLRLRSQVKKGLADAYMSELRMAFESLDEEVLRTEMIEEIVSRVNRERKPRPVAVADPKTVAIDAVNAALRRSDPKATVAALRNPALGLSCGVIPQAASLYHSELAYIQRESQADLRIEGIAGLCEFLTTIARINEAAVFAQGGNNAADIWTRLNEPEANIEDLNLKHKKLYAEGLYKCVFTFFFFCMTLSK